MNRFIVVYVHQETYRHISCQSQGEAQDCLAHVFVREGGTPMGIYDAKTELFHWEASRQHHYDQLCLEEQGRLGHHMIAIAQSLLTSCAPVAALITAPLRAQGKPGRRIGDQLDQLLTHEVLYPLDQQLRQGSVCVMDQQPGNTTYGCGINNRYTAPRSPPRE